MNINKLFPRLTIRTKLTISFVLLAGFPVVLVSVFAAHLKLAHLRVTSAEVLEHDLQIARGQIERAVVDAEQHVAFLTRMDLAPLLVDRSAQSLADAKRRVTVFLQHNPSLHRVVLIDAEGNILLTTLASGRIASDKPDSRGGLYYASRAKSLHSDSQLLLLGEPGDSSSVPTAAIVIAIRDEAGTFLGAVAGELPVSQLFAGVESGSPYMRGVTTLMNRDGFVLYDSGIWSSRPASHARLDATRESSAGHAAQMAARGSGTVVMDGKLVSLVPLKLRNIDIGPLSIYREVKLATLEAPVRSFMRAVGVTAIVLAFLLACAILMAGQFTRPIYRLREGMRQLAAGGIPTPLQIETNDELEDLADEFASMSTSLIAYRQRLEQLVAERTKALHETYGELASILANSADAIVGLDAAGHVRVWNRGAEALFGYTPGDAVGRHVESLIYPQEWELSQEALFVRRKLDEDGAVVDFRTLRLHKDGHLVPVSLSQSVIRNGGEERLGYSLILRDASLQARLETQLRRSERLAAASVIAAGLAHEVNNPLAIIANRIECMQRDIRNVCPQCRFDGDFSVLHEQTERLAGITRALLALANGDVDVRATVDADVIAARMCRLVEPSFSARDIRLELRRAEAVIGEFQGHEKALETVLLNLLLNAADATPAGGSIQLETRLGRGGLEVEFEVRDTGSGIPAELRERIFEPFFTTKGSRGGTGLGLAVCRAVIERNGGRITMQSEEGTGSRFVVAVPMVPAVPA